MASNLTYSLELTTEQVRTALGNLKKSLDTLKPNLDVTGFNSSLQKAQLKVDLLKNKLEQLSNSKLSISENINISKDKIANLQVKLQELNAKPTSVKVSADIQTAQAQITKLNNDIRSTTTSSKKIDLDISSTQSAIKKLEKNIEYAIITGSKIGSSQIKSHFGDLGLGNLLKSQIIAGLAVQGITVAVQGIGAVIGNAFNLSLDFNAQIASIKALGGITEQEMGKVRTAVEKAGKETAFSSLQAAQGFEELSKAGMSTEQILNGGLTASLNLATAGSLTVAEAAGITSTALATFAKDGMSASQAADILAGAANSSKTDVAGLSLGLSQVGVVAAGLGSTFKDTSTTLAVFAKNGLVGSDAGTSLRTMLARLQPATKETTALFKELGLTSKENVTKQNKMGNAFFDANGKIKSMAEVSQILKDKLGGLSEAQRQATLNTLFGSDAVRGATILTEQGADGFAKMTAEIEKVTVAQVAGEKLKSLKGSLQLLSGTLETMQISALTRLEPAFIKASQSIDKFLQTLDIDKMTDFVVNGISGLVDTLSTLDFAKVGADILSFIKIVGSIATGLFAAQTTFSVLTGALKLFKSVMLLVTLGTGPFAAAFALFLSPIGLIAIGIGLLVGAGTYLYLNWEQLSTQFPILQQGLDTVKGAFESMTAIFKSIDFGAIFSALFSLDFGKLSQEFGKIGSTIGTEIEKAKPFIAKAFGDLFTNIKIPEFALPFVDIVKKGIDDTKTKIDEFGKSINSIGTWLQDNEKWATSFSIVLGTLASATIAQASASTVAAGAMNVVKTAQDLWTGSVAAYNFVASGQAAGFVVGRLNMLAYSIQIGISTIATNLYTGALGIATIAGNAFGATLAFITSPVFLIVAAIGALMLITYLLVTNWETIGPFFAGLWESIKGFFGAGLDWIVAGTQSNFATIGAFFTGLGTSISTTISSLWTNIVAIWNAGINFIYTAIVNFGINAYGTWVNLGNNIRGAITFLWEGAKSLFNAGVNFVVTTISNFVTNIQNNFNNLKNTVTNTISGLWESAKSTFSNGVNGLIQSVTTLATSISTKFNDIKNSIVRTISSINLYSMGTDIVQGLINGIRNMGGQVSGALSGIVNGAVASAKSALGIQSPSRVMMQVGKYTGEGLVIGIDKMAKSAMDSMTNLVSLPKVDSFNLSSNTPNLDLASATRPQPRANFGNSNSNTTNNNQKNETRVTNNYGNNAQMPMLGRAWA